MESAFTRKLIAVFVAVTFLSFTVGAYAQPASPKDDVGMEQGKPVKAEKLEKMAVKGKFDKLHRIDQEMIALDADLASRGFKKKDKPDNHFGARNTYKDDDGEDIIVELLVQDYGPDTGDDAAALGQISVTSKGRSDVYSFALIAPKGKVKESLELTVDRDTKVINANSWWSCMQGQLAGVGSSCVTALVGCVQTAVAGGPFSWAVYLGCVAIGCGVPFGYASACCGCNCNWWCRWIGCCRQ